MPTYPFPIAPQAYNWWEGNKFRMPPLGQYARPQYAEALAPLAASDPALAQAVPQAAPLGGLSGFTNDPGTEDPNDRMTGSVPMSGFLAETSDWRDVIPSTPGAVFGSLIGQSLVNGIAGNPDRPITGVGLRDLGGSIGDAFGWGGSSHYSPMAPEYAYADPDLSVLSGGGDYAHADPYGGSYSGYASFSGGDPEAGGAAYDSSAYEGGDYEGGYAKGGKVRGLLGPNPPGPDDGFASLDRGEFVVRKSMAKKHAGLLHAINRGKVSKRKGRSLLD